MRYIYTGQLLAPRIAGSSWEKIIGDFKVGAPLEHDDDLASIHELTDYGEETPNNKVQYSEHFSFDHLDFIFHRSAVWTGAQWRVPSPIAGSDRTIIVRPQQAFAIKGHRAKDRCRHIPSSLDRASSEPYTSAIKQSARIQWWDWHSKR